MFDCPTNLAITNAWITGVLKLKCQCSIGRCTENVLCLVDIRQWVRVGARRCNARGASGCCGGGIACLACSGMRRQGKRTQLSRSPSPSSEYPNAFNRDTGSGV